jgi:heme-degrading monooxygenase HmoA
MSSAPSTPTWIALAEADDGFLGIEAVRNADGSGITVIYWKGLDSIAAFARDPRHLIAKGRSTESGSRTT